MEFEQNKIELYFQIYHNAAHLKHTRSSTIPKDNDLE